MIKTVIRLRNGEVMVFDSDGEQVPEYQGQYEAVKERILTVAPPGARFCHWFDPAGGPESVSKGSW